MDFLLSIIIPVYRVEDYIERCLLSVIGQDYAGVAVECILVDDCSPDNSIQVAEKVISSYQGNITFVVIRCQQNGGLSVARNTGMRQARGKYLFFLDSDDYLTDTCMELFFQQIAAHPDAQMIMGNNYNVSTKEPFINSQRIPQGVINNDELLELYYQTYIPVMAWNSMILRELVEQNNLFFTPGILNEDMLWSAQLFHCVQRFVFLPDITLIYEYNPNSIINTLDKHLDKFIHSNDVILKGLLSLPSGQHEVSNMLYIMNQLMYVLDVTRSRGVLHRDDCKGILEARNRLVRRILRRGRLILFVYASLMYRPMNLLVKLKVFRKNYNRLQQLVRRLAKFFDFLH